ncbi:uncharacterized protein [Rutidosis leptorrhynchoides]|uniref:uncharacterized protein n=1 Tax=Rutidosis leptorrhynchoides TaxID=125765 RepID=UPI003A9A6268
MVVNMMKWRPWPPLSSKQFQAKIIVHSLHGLPELTTSSPISGGDDYSKLRVEVKWKGCDKSSNLIKLKRHSLKTEISKEGSMNDDGVVEWNEEFVGVCDLVRFRDGGFHNWEVAFKVFDGLNQGPKKWDHAVATGSLNLAEFLSAGQEMTPICIHLSVPSSTECSPMLSVSLSLQELKTTHNISELARRSVTPVNEDEPSGLKAGLKNVKIFKIISAHRAKRACRDEDGSGKSSVRSDGADYPFDTDSLEGTDLEEVDYADSNIKKSLSYGTLTSYFNSSSSEDGDRIYYQSHGTKNADDLNLSAVVRSERPVSKRSIFRWRKRKLSFRSPKAKGEPLLKRDVREEGGDDIDFDRRMLTSSDESSYGWHRSEEGSTTSRSSTSEFGDDNFVVGKWGNKEVISRDGHMTIQTQIFFASIDQRSEKASGESACTSLVATIAEWFHKNRHLMPIKSELDTLIREGSLEWRNLCENEVYRKRFPDKHFDLETVLQAEARISVVPDKSFIGFFQPDGQEGKVFDFLNGAMSFDSIWDEISQIGSNHSNNLHPLVYIVSWNDHFFILKVEKDAYFIIDTLGERLHEGCNQAFILKFDQDTTIRRKSTEQVDANSLSKSTKEEFVVSKGKESCKEYIKSFLAAIPLRELQADVKKGLLAASSPLVHHRLQIEFHYTKCL